MPSVSGQALLSADSCIIEEQENHLVIAIRVPKATIAGNIPVFAAMAKISGAGDQRVLKHQSRPTIEVKRMGHRWIFPTNVRLETEIAAAQP